MSTSEFLSGPDEARALPPGMNLRQLAYLRAVAHHGGSVTRAAGALGISQPALSQSLTELERRLGVALFEAAGRSRHLTNDGLEVVAFAERMLAETAALQERLGARASGATGSLRVGMIDAASLYVLPEAIRIYRQQYSAVDLHLRVDTSTQLVNQLRSFDLDLVFAIGPPDEDLHAVELWREPLHLYAPPGARLEAPDVEAEWVLYPARSRTRAAIDAGLARRGIRPRVTLESDNPEVLRQMVALGLGWSVLPPAVAAGSPVLEGRQGVQVAERALFGMHRAASTANPRVEAFLQLALAAQTHPAGPLPRADSAT